MTPDRRRVPVRFVAMHRHDTALAAFQPIIAPMSTGRYQPGGHHVIPPDRRIHVSRFSAPSTMTRISLVTLPVHPVDNNPTDNVYAAALEGWPGSKQIVAESGG